MAVLTEPMTSQEIGGRLKVRGGSHIPVIKRMYDAGVLSRARHPYLSRVYVYKREQETTTSAEVKAMLTAKNKAYDVPTIQGARLITFNSEEMKEKLKQNDKLNRRKSGKIYDGSSWNYDV